MCDWCIFSFHSSFSPPSHTNKSSVGPEAQGHWVLQTAAGLQRTWVAVVKKISQSRPWNHIHNVQISMKCTKITEWRRNPEDVFKGLKIFTLLNYKFHFFSVFLTIAYSYTINIKPCSSSCKWWILNSPMLCTKCPIKEIHLMLISPAQVILSADALLL